MERGRCHAGSRTPACRGERPGPGRACPGLTITVSLGVTELRPSDRSLDQLLRRADRALYEAKKLGRNRVEQLLD
ncbi:diguanylate cyclase [Dyella sp. KULCS107]|uniref:diguanylate cyclase n=1 Tax=Dyella sp. KULCS107 TaxID=3422216 RepID=UPI003D6F076B